ncbi:MAG: aryl-sulfate sulfotransferase [Actinomycetota bacterium]
MRRPLLALATLALIAGSCSADDPEPEAAPDETASSSAPESTTTTAEPDPEPEAVEFELAVDAVVAERVGLAATVTVSANVPVTVRLEAVSDDGHTITSPPTAATTTDHVLPFLGMRADRTYALSAVAFDTDGTELGRATTDITSGPLIPAVPDFVFESDPDRVQPGLTFIEFAELGFGEQVEPGTGFVVDEDGEVVWFYDAAEMLTSIRLLGDGTFVTNVGQPSTRTVHLDFLGGELGRWHYPGEADEGIEIAVDEPARTPHHDVEFLPNGNLLSLAMIEHPVDEALRQELCPGDDNEWRAISDLIVEVEPDTGRVVRTWDLWDVIDIAELPGTGLCDIQNLFSTETTRDWSHANAATYDPVRDQVIVSVRHTDQVIAFEHPDREGRITDVAWILGAGGTLSVDGEPTYHQHAPQILENGNLLVYDNGNTRPGAEDTGGFGQTPDPDAPEPYTRVVEYELDPDAGTARQVWEYRTIDPFDDTLLFSRFVGDANRLPNGNVLINHGGITNASAPVDVLVIEVDPDPDSGGEIVMSIDVQGPQGTLFGSFRAERIETLFQQAVWAG